jgi:hypothetical protein
VPPIPRIVVSHGGPPGPPGPLGTVRAGGDSPLDGSVEIRADFDQPAQQTGARLGLAVSVDGAVRPDAAGLPGPGGQSVASAELVPAAPTTTLTYHLTASKDERFWPGTVCRAVVVVLTPLPGTVQVVDRDGRPIDRLDFSYCVEFPWDERHWRLLGALLALLALLLFVLSRPRIPGGLLIDVTGAQARQVRTLPKPRWIDGQIIIGGPGAHVLVPDVLRRVCKIRPNWNCFIGIPARPGTKLYVRPEPDVTITIGGSEVDQGRWTPFYPEDVLVAKVPTGNPALPMQFVRISFKLPP